MTANAIGISVFANALISKNHASFNSVGIFAATCPSHLIGNIAVNNTGNNVSTGIGACTVVDNNTATP